MSFNFVIPEMTINGGNDINKTFEFFRRGFVLGGKSSTPSYRDIVLSGVGALTLSNALANGLNYLKLFGGCEQRNLPEGYTQAKYLRQVYQYNTGYYSYLQKHIDTGYIPYGDEAFEFSLKVNSLPTSSGKFIVPFGERVGALGTATTNCWLGISYEGEVFCRCGTVNPTVSLTIATNTIYNFKVDLASGVLTINGTDYTMTDTEVSVSDSIWLMSLNQVQGGASGNITCEGSFDLCDFKISRNGSVVYNALPLTSVGVYDTISNTANTTIDGTYGEITAGDEAVPTPSQPMDIWCNNGVLKARHESGLPLGYTLYNGLIGDGNAYIDLGCTLDQDDEIEIEFTKSSNVASKDVFGARTAASSNNISVILAGSGNIVEDFNNSDYNPYRLNQAISLNTRYKIVMNKTGRYLYNSAGTLVASNTIACPDTITTVGCYLFNLAGNGLGYKFVGTIHRCYIKGKRDVVPASNGTAYGMYDKINGGFYTNVNETGSFTVGSAVSDPVVIYADGTVETVKVFGKNLFNKNSYTEINAYVNSNTGVLTQGSSGASTQYCAVIPCLPNTTYTISGRSNSAWGAFTSSEIGTTATSYSKTENGSITTGANDKYLIGLVRANQDAIDYRNALQVELGSSATTYEPYFNGGTATAEMLLKVGTYQDVQSVLDGQVTRNVCVKVLDGTENWLIWANGNGFMYNESNMVNQTNGAGLSTHAKNVSTITALGIRFGASNNQYIYLCQWQSALGISTVDAFKQWLKDQYNAGQPVIILYPLATATTESVTAQPLTIQAGTNIVEITQASIDDLSLEVSYKATI